MLARDITLGRTPLSAFLVTIGVALSLCAVFAVVLIEAPPTVMVRGAPGEGMVAPAAYDLAYNDAVGRAFLAGYGTWSADSFDRKMKTALALAGDELAARLAREAATGRQQVSVLKMAHDLTIESARVVREDAAAGVSVIAYRVLESDAMGRFGSGEAPRPATYTLTIRWAVPEGASPYCAKVIDMNRKIASAP